jgi:RNA polymerase sigma-B factor
MNKQEAREEGDSRLWSTYAAHPSRQLREQLIESYRPLVRAILKRMDGRGDEDLEQVALLGLVKAVDRFDPSSGNRFTTFAYPTVIGEIKRYRRDRSHLIRPHRALIDLRVAVSAREAALTASTGHPPTVAEIAAALGVEIEQVAEAMALEEACHPRSLDELMVWRECEQFVLLEECVGKDDPEIERAETRILWRQAIETLDPLLRQVVDLRFYDKLTQEQVAQRLGVSQMHISRLERRALHQLREHLASVTEGAPCLA